jgi:hypothetical protein
MWVKEPISFGNHLGRTESHHAFFNNIQKDNHILMSVEVVVAAGVVILVVSPAVRVAFI